MGYQAVFKRYEMKYMLTLEQKESVLRSMTDYMELDRYGRSSIRNIYYDTASYGLIRASIDKPAYKEKLRIRSYGRASDGSPVFVELKKKYRGVVYKRRISMTEREAVSFLSGGAPPYDSQIAREIEYLRDFYRGIDKRLHLSYEREAYYMKDGGDFRVTFDDNILAREDTLSLDSEAYGYPLLEDGRVLMELKCSGGIPLAMARTLSELGIYKSSFSKYGRAYGALILPTLDKFYNTKEI